MRDREGIGKGTQSRIRRVHSIIGGDLVVGGVVGIVSNKEIELAKGQERGTMQGGAWGVTSG